MDIHDVASECSVNNNFDIVNVNHLVMLRSRPHTTLEEFENEGFALKTRVFHPHYPGAI